MKHLNGDVNGFWISRLWDAVKLEQKVEKESTKKVQAQLTHSCLMLLGKWLEETFLLNRLLKVHFRRVTG